MILDGTGFAPCLSPSPGLGTGSDVTGWFCLSGFVPTSACGPSSSVFVFVCVLLVISVGFSVGLTSPPFMSASVSIFAIEFICISVSTWLIG